MGPTLKEEKVASFNKIAAIHTLLIYHLIDGIDKISVIFSLDLYISRLPDGKTEDRPGDLLPEYLRFCLAAVFLGGSIYGTAKKQLYTGQHPIVGGLILTFGQLATLWCLTTSLLEPELLPSTAKFFGFLSVGLIWTSFIHIGSFMRQYSSRSDDETGEVDAVPNTSKSVIEALLSAGEKTNFLPLPIPMRTSKEPETLPDGMKVKIYAGFEHYETISEPPRSSILFEYCAGSAASTFRP
ncbi:hypothetical protein K461DRAFT_296935 [Myriangium duriaei CBS 260.36]|uniref:Uncharacterized protein n=1 Tax=Myriangium duriaei CBS 260.36 TaxID=1168546 RepID=A0A9P4IVD2_9PEZI|nr:hypothetical protein K461DRAFT_296935 [Myriangium duriaei CBS 260.36]